MEAGLPALTVLFGLQTMRVLIPSIVYAYGVQPGVTSIQMGIYAFGVFSVAFLAAALRRLLGPRASLAITAGGVALLRLAEQLSLAPLVDLILASLGTALFTMFLPIYLGHIRGQGSEATGRYALGLLLGLALDTGLHGALGTYDLSWQLGIGPVLLVLFLVLIQLALLARTLVLTPSPQGGGGEGLALALGPFLFLQALLFQNVAQATVLTGWAQPTAFAWIVLANVAGIVAWVAAVSEAPRVRWFDALLVGVALGVALLFLRQGGWAGALWLLVGQICAAGELTLILIGLGARADRRGLWRTAVANGLGMLLFVLLLFAYYISYDLKVPYENVILPPIAAGILVLCAIGATRLLPQARRSAPDWTPVWVALALLVLPLGLWAIWRQPQPVAGRGWPVRVMTYNLHQGFDTKGRLGMEALARVIEESGAEVVALQEVSRGWYINASLDMLTWLSRRLNMPYIFGPTADPLWGNAILSRYHVLEHGNVLLPRGGVPLKRGFLWARIDLGGGETMLMIATHLHHVEEEGHVRLLQVPAILDFWAGRDRTVILGDMNAKPHTPEIAMYRDAGLRDAFAEIGMGSGYTFISSGPYMRIDYIWVSPDLKVSDLLIPQSTASDHLGVVVTVGR
jgi:endonuclease/exonuclease/phosphatase family metal-dependent hydrolase